MFHAEAVIPIKNFCCTEHIIDIWYDTNISILKIDILIQIDYDHYIS